MGCATVLRTLQRSLIMGERIIYENKKQSRVCAPCCRASQFARYQGAHIARELVNGANVLTCWKPDAEKDCANAYFWHWNSS